ncbi:hypothetical protein TEA_013434 [Camellia sinensis var. sinensis]|uniref:Uncharacterized protein n=1 Tax=Camellia sinensis var. sinensis TaxID=542762 RepID=A0A4S4E0J9_CAMSN|nr:hypothetical protein TEA_013434 [Camellia sinensis var. sinensis]
MGKKRKSVATSLDEVDRTMYSTFCSAANSLSQLYTQAMNQQKLSFQTGERHGLIQLSFRRVVVFLLLRILFLHVFATSVGIRALLSSQPWDSYMESIVDSLTLCLVGVFGKGVGNEKGKGSLGWLELSISNVKISSRSPTGLGIASSPKPFNILISKWQAMVPCHLHCIYGCQTELDYCGEEPSVSPRAPPQNHHSQSTMHSTNSGFLVSSGSSGAPNAAQGFQTEHSEQQPKNYVFSNALSSPVRRSLQNYHIAQGFRNNEPNFVQQQNRDSNSLNSNDSSMDMHADSPSQSHESTY